MSKWIVYWDNAWHPNGKGRQFTRYGDAIKFAKKQQAKPTTGRVDISWDGVPFTWTNRYTKEKYTILDSTEISALPDWLLE
jgi:hypothetical protein